MRVFRRIVERATPCLSGNDDNGASRAPFIRTVSYRMQRCMRRQRLRCACRRIHDQQSRAHATDVAALGVDFPMWYLCAVTSRAPARLTAALVAAAAAACSNPAPSGYQGYVEGEFVNVASPIAGRLDELSVKRGDNVAINARLYALEAVSEAAAQRQAQEQVKAAEATLADLRAGRRLPEQDVTRAQLGQAEVELKRAATNLARDEAQYRIGGIARAQLDDARSAHEAAQARVAQLRSELKVTQLPSRTEQIQAQAAQAAAARAALEQATWKLDQKSVRATRAGRVYDTLYREGEWVAAGSPVVRMLPPSNVKVRFFVPQTIVGSLAPGRAVAIQCDGCGAEIPATISYISNEAEFTPPVIYSNETRSKLVFMVEARPSPENAAKLNPGQPVSVSLK
jgi:HlyD family secretion protein